MQFEENNCLKLQKINNIFVYFLVKNNEVIYVGQTKNGIMRPYQHKYDKDFDTIYIKYCDKDNLDYLEDFYIKKYNPIYNKVLNTQLNYSLSKIKNSIKNIHPEFNLIKLKKIIKTLDIPINTFNKIITIDQKYYLDILKYYEEVILDGRTKASI